MWHTYGILVALTSVLLLSKVSAQTVPPTVTLLTNIPYPTASSPLLMDICQPNPLQGSYPTIVLTHGGGFRNGSKNDLRAECIALAEEGFVAASIEYRLTDTDPFPAQIDDAQMAVRFLRKHADLYGIQPDNFGALGGSAGGYLATMLGVMTTRDATIAPTGYSSTVQVVIDRSGAPMNMNNPATLPAPGSPYYQLSLDILFPYLGVTSMNQITQQMRDDISPVTYASSGDAPLLAVHSINDQLAPIQNAEDIVSRLTSFGVTATLLSFDGVGNGHGRDALPANQEQQLWNQELAFLRTHLSSQSTPTNTPVPLLGDVTRDGSVDMADILLLVANFGRRGLSPSNILTNGVVDIFDFTVVVSQFGAHL